MRLDEAYSFISLSTIQCCQCGEVGHWEQIEWYSDRGGLWLLRCVDCEGEQYEDEYEQNYFECPDCGGEMTVTPYPNEDQLDGYMTYCPLTFHGISGSRVMFENPAKTNKSRYTNKDLLVKKIKTYEGEGLRQRMSDKM